MNDREGERGGTRRREREAKYDKLYVGRERLK